MTDAASEPPVLVSRRGRLGHLELNRPRALNALNLDMVRILRQTLDEWADDDDVSTVLLTGAGERGSARAATSSASTATPAKAARRARRSGARSTRSTP